MGSRFGLMSKRDFVCGRKAATLFANPIDFVTLFAILAALFEGLS